MRLLQQLRPREPRLWFGGGWPRVSPSPLILFSFPYLRSLTSLCDAELGSEASRAAEASRVEAQRLKEKAEAFRVAARHWELKAKGEFRRLPSLFSSFFLSLIPIPFSVVQSQRRRLPGQPRLPAWCRQCSRPRSGSMRRWRVPPVPPMRPWWSRGFSQAAPLGAV